MEARQIHIRLANENETLSVDESVLRACSAVARGLPSKADVWDLSNLLIDGEPVQRSTVIQWLNLCYSGVHGEPFAEQQEQLPFTRVLDLFRMLAFADSIGAAGGSIKPSVTEDVLMKLPMEVTIDPQQQQQQQQQQDQHQQQQQEQQMDEDPYTFLLTLRRNSYGWTTARDASSRTYQLPAAAPERSVSAAAKDAVTAQVAAQTEQLLYIAYKLQLQELVQLLKDFLTAATTTQRRSDPLLTSDMLAQAIYSPRVLEAAGYNDAAGRAAWVRSQLQRSLLGGTQPLLEYAWLHESLDRLPDRITFPANLRRAFSSMRKGSLVNVEINLLEHEVQLEAGDWAWQMPLGMDVTDNV